jgi:hypothetical protein
LAESSSSEPSSSERSSFIPLPETALPTTSVPYCGKLKKDVPEKNAPYEEVPEDVEKLEE